jgi:hypothetical protein
MHVFLPSKNNFTRKKLTLEIRKNTLQGNNFYNVKSLHDWMNHHSYNRKNLFKNLFLKLDFLKLYLLKSNTN